MAQTDPPYFTHRTLLLQFLTKNLMGGGGVRGVLVISVYVTPVYTVEIERKNAL